MERCVVKILGAKATNFAACFYNEKKVAEGTAECISMRNFGELGDYNLLTIKRKSDYGLYLADDKGEEVLLPVRYVTDEMKTGEELKVFLYLDSEDRPVATTDEPLITMDRIAALKVQDVNKVGAFLDWGLPKDLFLPYGQMTAKVNPGDEILVRLYADKSGRLAASMKGLYHYLSLNPPYEAKDEVSGRIYEFGHDYGTFVAVDDKYSAMIPRHEDTRNLRIGDVISARVTSVKEDGKLDITMKKKIDEQMDEDADKVMSVIESYAGVLPFSEKASPEVIFRETGLSKAAFKRAVGRLYKNRLITITEGKIRKA